MTKGKKSDSLATHDGNPSPVEFVIPVQTVSADMFEGMTIEQTVSLEDGQSITGIFRGEGTPVTAKNSVEREVVDSETGEVTVRKETREVPLKTWRIEIAPGQIALLVSSAQLDTKMPGIPVGARVAVGRLGSGRTRHGNQITRYVVGHKEG